MEQEILVKVSGLTGQTKVIEVVLNSLSSKHSRRAYERALKDFLLWHQQQGKPPLDKALVQSYVAHLRDKKLSSASINQRLAAIRKLVAEAADGGALDQQTANIIRSVKGIKQEGRKTGNWLTKTQAQQFINCISSNSLKGLRDRVIIALLVGCGLRRNELAELEIAQIQQREGRWVIVDLLGKRNKLRTVPMPSWAKVAVDEWFEATNLEQGKLLRPINKGEKVYGEAMTAQAIRNIVVGYSEQLDLVVSPHDLRRTFAKLAHKGGAPLEQIQIALGHSSIKTTEVYLGVEQDLANAPCDFLGLKLEQSPNQIQTVPTTNEQAASKTVSTPSTKANKGTLPDINPLKTTKVKMYLRIENNNKFVRGKKKTLEDIEFFVFPNYNIKDLGDWYYELTFSYTDDENLEEQIYALAQEMNYQADLRNCFVEVDFQEIGTDRHW